MIPSTWIDHAPYLLIFTGYLALKTCDFSQIAPRQTLAMALRLGATWLMQRASCRKITKLEW
jgi:hypothetical protein